MGQIGLIAAGDTAYCQPGPLDQPKLGNGLVRIFRTTRVKIAFDAKTLTTPAAFLVAMN